MGRIQVSDALEKKIQQAAQQKGCSVESLLDKLLANSYDPLGVLELAADAVIAIDEKQQIVEFNSSARQIFQYQPEEIIGQPLSILLPDELKTDHERYVTGFACSEQVSRHMAERTPVFGKRKDGSHFLAEVSISKYRLDDKSYCLALLRDISDREAITQQLKEKTAQLELLTGHATDLICLHEPDGTMIYVSPSSRKIGGYEPEDLIGKTPYEYFHPDDLEQIQASHDTALEGKSVASVIYRHRRKDGKYIWLETRTNPVLDEHGNVTHLVTGSRDITARIELEEALKQERDLLSLIMETSPSAITVVDNNGNIIFANARAKEVHPPRDGITELTYDAAEWKHTDYDGNPWPDEKQPFVRVMETKAPVWDVRHAIEGPDGGRIYLAINGAPILDENGEVSKVVFTVEDYTQRKLQQDELEAALERQRTLLEMKTRFLSMVSHEFRTPMAVIMTSTGLIRRNYQKLSETQAIRHLLKIEDQIKRLSSLISDVTFINKNDLLNPQVHPEPIGLEVFFENLAEEVNTIYPNHQPIQTVGNVSNNPVMLDRKLLEQIVINLLTNAMKYSEPDTTVTMSYTCDTKSLTLLVIDEGIGIPEEDQIALFEIFHRARNVGARMGTGVGLAIVKRAVEMMNGTITFESEEGVGTKFLVTLPVNLPEMAGV